MNNKEASFDDLVQAIQQAFIKVNDMSERQHISMIQEYFNADGSPKTFDIQYPYFNEVGEAAYRRVSIPQLCLIPITSLKLDEIKVDFKVRLYGKVNLKQQNNLLRSNGEAGEENKDGNNTFLGYIPHGSRRADKEDSFADIKLKFVSQDPPEGLMRIRDQFIKITI